jgi:hypothetical protein
MRQHTKRHTLAPAMFDKNVLSLDFDLSCLDYEDFSQKSQATKNRFAVKTFLKQMYGKYTHQ